MAIINCVEWRPAGKNIFAWRYPHNNLSTATQLLVQESQEAVLFSKGQILGKFGPGKHTLSTENLPILRSLYGIPFGGKNPFTAEVWFVNKLQPLNLTWYINSFSIHDADYNTFLPLTAEGRYGLRLQNAEKFLVTIVGTKDEFTEHDLLDQFDGDLTAKVKSAIAQFMQNNRIGFKQLAPHLDNFSTYLKDILSPFWAEIGFDLIRFNVNTIDIDEETPEGRKLKQAIAQQSAMAITGHTWQQEQMFDTANSAINGMTDGMGSGNGGLLGGLMAINMMGSMGAGMGGGMMQAGYSGPNFGGSAASMSANPNAGMPQQTQMPKMVYCSNCAKKFSNTMKFCPHCGNAYHPCPACGTDNPENAQRCVSCGTALHNATQECPHCHAKIAQGSTFCGNCGSPIMGASDTCSRCGATFASPSIKFCPCCGQKR